MRRVISFLLIFALSCLLLPKELLHECDHQHFLKHSIISHADDCKDYSLSIENKECPICNLEYFQEYIPLNALHVPNPVYFTARSVYLLAVCVTKDLQIPDTRGSPLKIS